MHTQITKQRFQLAFLLFVALFPTRINQIEYYVYIIRILHESAMLIDDVNKQSIKTTETWYYIKAKMDIEGEILTLSPFKTETTLKKQMDNI